ncbi:MAG: RNA-binding S4 domain-containing protein [Chitinophagaceae bacterium]|nr:MAG: RNA-binding S4 domain-containing protein [Chitinophagaceae bacterium]
MKTETKEKVRIDKYLWSIRLFKTRSEAAAACESGKVRLNGSPVKAARNVAVGDEYEVRTEARKWVIKVAALLANRVAYPEAIKHYIDLTPEEQAVPNKHLGSSFHTGKRPSKIGRPTKKQRRDLGDILGEEGAPEEAD